MKREDTYEVRVKVNIGDTILDLGVWDKMSGGEGDSNESRYRPGGLAAEVSLGGTKTIGNVTASKLYDESVDSWFHQVYEARGAATVDLSKQPLGADGNPKGRALGYSGVLKAVTPPDHDSESSDAALVAIEFVPNGSLL